MCWSSYNFSQDLWHTTNGLHKKFPIKTCGMSDDLSGDMLAPSWPNLVEMWSYYKSFVGLPTRNIILAAWASYSSIVYFNAV